MDEEHWKPCANFPLYEVSDMGRVRNSKTRRVLKGHLEKWGYVSVMFSTWPNGKRLRKRIRIHRLVLEAFVGPCPVGYEALHKNGIRADNRLSNIRWGTPAENRRDAKRHGTAAIMDRHPFSKLTSKDVEEIRRLCSAGIPQRQIARRFGITQSNVSYIKRGITWVNSPDTFEERRQKARKSDGTKRFGNL